MGFRDELLKLSEQVKERKEHINNEEMTKQALIIPFIHILGFDIFNPLEVKSEYDADISRKKGEKVDYAIFKDGQPIIFIEAKSVSENINNHDKQLARYYNTTPNVRLAILTNGINYKFFTDLESTNIMDENPFLTIDITNISDTDIESLSQFVKENFIMEDVVKFAEELTYTTNLNKKLKEIFKNPPDDFIRYLIKDFSDNRITTNVIERFRPIVKKSISKTLLDMVTQSLSTDDEENITKADYDQDNEHSQDLKDKADENTKEESKSKKSIITTDEELQAYEYVKEILQKNNRDIAELSYKDTTNYFGIYKRVTTNWLLRLIFDSKCKNIITKLPLEEIGPIVSTKFKCDNAPKSVGESRIYVNEPEDINELSSVIIACYDQSK